VRLRYRILTRRPYLHTRWQAHLEAWQGASRLRRNRAILDISIRSASRKSVDQCKGGADILGYCILTCKILPHPDCQAHPYRLDSHRHQYRARRVWVSSINHLRPTRPLRLIPSVENRRSASPSRAINPMTPNYRESSCWTFGVLWRMKMEMRVGDLESSASSV